MGDPELHGHAGTFFFGVNQRGPGQVQHPTTNFTKSWDNFIVCDVNKPSLGKNLENRKKLTFTVFYFSTLRRKTTIQYNDEIFHSHFGSWLILMTSKFEMSFYSCLKIVLRQLDKVSVLYESQFEPPSIYTLHFYNSPVL